MPFGLPDANDIKTAGDAVVDHAEVEIEKAEDHAVAALQKVLTEFLTRIEQILDEREVVVTFPKKAPK